MDIVALIIPIAGAIATIIPVINSVTNNGKKTSDKIDQVSKKMDMQSRDIQRLTLHDEHLPIEERLAAGDRYIKLDGNGATKVYYGKLCEKYKASIKEESL